jgi:integral membrane protein
MELPPMNALARLRLVTWVEGISLLVLLFVAMPLKHVFGMPLAVRVVGSIHGILFLAFVSLLFSAASEKEWPARRTFIAFVEASLPFGFLLLDRSLRDEPSAAP